MPLFKGNYRALVFYSSFFREQCAKMIGRKGYVCYYMNVQGGGGKVGVGEAAKIPQEFSFAASPAGEPWSERCAF